MSSSTSQRVLKALTPKQNRFARLVASGKTYSDAYREAYDCDKSSDAVINNEASLLMQDRVISMRVDQLQAEISRSVVASSLNDRERALARLREVAFDNKVISVMELRALELVAKASGAFDDEHRGKERDGRTAAQIEEELKRRVATLIEESVDSGALLIEGEVITDDVAAAEDDFPFL